MDYAATLAQINAQLAIKNGCVYVQTMTNTTRVTAKNQIAWTKAGRALFTGDATGLYMAKGKGRVCISYTKISLTTW